MAYPQNTAVWQPGDIELVAFVHIPSQTYHVVSWVTSDFSLSDVPSNTKIRVTRGTSREGPHSIVVADNLPLSVTSVIDLDVPPVGQRWQPVIYAVEIVGNDELLARDAVEATSPESKYGIRLADNLRRRLVKTHGRPWHHLSRKTYGMRCPDCYDEFRSRITKENCKSCYGTTYLDGYEKPHPVNVGSLSPTEAIEKRIFADVQDSNTTIWLTNDPRVRPGDVFIEEDFKRWRVLQISPREYRKTLYRQDILANEIDPDDAVFGITV